MANPAARTKGIATDARNAYFVAIEPTEAASQFVMLLNNRTSCSRRFQRCFQERTR